jgi:hypothetical protein
VSLPVGETRQPTVPPVNSVPQHGFPPAASPASEPTQQLDFRRAGGPNSSPQDGYPSPSAGRPPNPVPHQPLPPSGSGQGKPRPEQSRQSGAIPGRSAQQPDPARPADAPAGPRPERRRRLFAGIGVAAAVAVAVTMIVLSRHPGDSGNQAGSSSMVSALTSGANAAGPTRPNTTSKQVPPPGAAASDPLIPGYQVVLIPARGAAYDAPADWKTDPAGATTWGSASGTLDVAGLARDGANYCPNGVRTSAFLTTSAQADPAAAATDVGERMAKIGWPTTTGTTSGPAEQLTTLDGQVHGTFVETTGTASAPGPNCAKTFSIYTFAFPSENGNFVMTIAADTGVTKSIEKATAQQILTSIRPLPDH